MKPTLHSAGALAALAALVLLFAFPSLVAGQAIDSPGSGVTLAAQGNESLTVTLTGATTVNFDLDAGVSVPGDAAVSIQTDWKLRGSRTTLELWGSFSSAADALTDGFGYSIPSSAVQGRVATGAPTSFTAFTSTGPFGAAGAALQLLDVSVSPPGHQGGRSDDLELQIDQTGLDLPAGDFTGTLTIQATAF